MQHKGKGKVQSLVLKYGESNSKTESSAWTSPTHFFKFILFIWNPSIYWSLSKFICYYHSNFLSLCVSVAKIPLYFYLFPVFCCIVYFVISSNFYFLSCGCFSFLFYITASAFSFLCNWLCVCVYKFDLVLIRGYSIWQLIVKVELYCNSRSCVFMFFWVFCNFTFWSICGNTLLVSTPLVSFLIWDG